MLPEPIEYHTLEEHEVLLRSRQHGLPNWLSSTGWSHKAATLPPPQPPPRPEDSATAVQRAALADYRCTGIGFCALATCLPPRSLHDFKHCVHTPSLVNPPRCRQAAFVAAMTHTLCSCLRHACQSPPVPSPKDLCIVPAGALYASSHILGRTYLWSGQVQQPSLQPVCLAVATVQRQQRARKSLQRSGRT